MAFLTPEMWPKKGFSKGSSWSFPAEDNQEAVADIHTGGSWEKAMKMGRKGRNLETTGGGMDLNFAQDIEE